VGGPRPARSPDPPRGRPGHRRPPRSHPRPPAAAPRPPPPAAENVFVNISSPSTSKYETVADLGTPDEVAQRYLKIYLGEFMSTRIGVKREAEVIAASERRNEDGTLFYDLEFRVSDPPPSCRAGPPPRSPRGRGSGGDAGAGGPWGGGLGDGRAAPPVPRRSSRSRRGSRWR